MERLSRVLITNDAPFGTSLSFACGFPPLADGSVSPTQQIEVLDELADALVLNGFKPGLDRFKEKASEEDIVALDDLLVHLRSTCEISTAFSMAAAHFYVPVAGGVIAKAPFWWMHLTLEKWLQLFDEGGDEVDSSITMECVNALFPARKGMPPIVLDRAAIRVRVLTPSADSHGDRPRSRARDMAAGFDRDAFSR
jgi:hypothetical protein